MTRPSRYLVRMFVFVTLVAGLAAVLSRPLVHYFMGNWLVNGVILLILAAGTLYIFRQVLMLYPEIGWIDRFRRNQGGVASDDMPRLLSPLATMLADRRGGKVSLSALSLRTLLDGIGTRLDETRETSDYLRGLLLFLGLLGTFYGLLETVQSVPAVVEGLSVGTNDAARAFGDFKAGLMPILSGMGTAFSASLFGLAGSLVIGFLGLQATLAQNLFFHDLEEWLSGYTRLSGGGALATDGGDASVPAFIQALLEQTADGLENLQRIMARGEESRIAANANTLALTERLTTFADQMRAGQALLLRLAEQQGDLKPVLARLAEGKGALGQDEARGHLRNIEVYLARLGEDVSQGRGEAVQEIRNEIRLLARTIAALAQEPQRG